jgi:hypothetical protein
MVAAVMLENFDHNSSRSNKSRLFDNIHGKSNPKTQNNNTIKATERNSSILIELILTEWRIRANQQRHSSH